MMVFELSYQERSSRLEPNEPMGKKDFDSDLID